MQSKWKKKIFHRHIWSKWKAKEEVEGRRGSGAYSDKRHLVETAGKYGLNELLVGQCQLRLFLVKVKSIASKLSQAEVGWGMGKGARGGRRQLRSNSRKFESVSSCEKDIPQKNPNCSVEKRTTRKKLGKQIAGKTKTKTKKQIRVAQICSTELNGKCEKGWPQKVKATLDAKFMRAAAAAARLPLLPPSLRLL